MTHSKQPTPHLLLLGAGYSSLAAAQLLQQKTTANHEQDQWQISATYRDNAKAEKLRELGIKPIKLGEVAPETTYTHILASAPPIRGDNNQSSDPFLTPEMAAWTQHIVTNNPIQWLGYLSATSVYGDHGGNWVDETTPTNPTGPRGKARLEAEQAWSALIHRHAPSAPYHIFRLSAIYGPTRNQITAIKAGAAKPIIKDGQYFSRMHRDDIAACICAAIDYAKDHAQAEIYNLADDCPLPPHRPPQMIAEKLGITPPIAVPFEQAHHLSAGAKSFYDDNKRVRNDKIKAQLGVQLRYPNFASSLNDLLNNQ